MKKFKILKVEVWTYFVEAEAIKIWDERNNKWQEKKLKKSKGRKKRGLSYSIDDNIDETIDRNIWLLWKRAT